MDCVEKLKYVSVNLKCLRQIGGSGLNMNIKFCMNYFYDIRIFPAETRSARGLHMKGPYEHYEDTCQDILRRLVMEMVADEPDGAQEFLCQPRLDVEVIPSPSLPRKIPDDT